MNFTFDQKRVDYIVNVLAQRPYAEVAETLNDFAAQINQQRNPQPLAAVPQQLGDAKPNGSAHQEAPA